MISIVIAIILTVLSFIFFNSDIAIVCGIIFLFFSVIANYIFKPNADGIQFDDREYKLLDTFKLYPLEDDYVRIIKSKSGKELVLFKSEGRGDKSINIRRLPKEKVRLIYDNENCIKLFIAKKKVYQKFFYSVFYVKAIDLGAEIHAIDDICKENIEKCYHN